jgi:hypothetical protein
MPGGKTAGDLLKFTAYAGKLGAGVTRRQCSCGWMEILNGQMVAVREDDGGGSVVLRDWRVAFRRDAYLMSR